MKKLFVVAAIALGLNFSANAQEAGNYWVGGAVSVGTSKIKDGEKFTNYSILPEVGYMINDTWGVGIELGYMHSENANGGNKQKINTFGVNPFVRWSYLKGDIGYLFVDGGVGYAHGKNKTTDVKTNLMEVGVRPGVAINVAKNVALLGKFGFLGYQYSKVGDTKTNSYGLDLDLTQIQLGVNFVF